MKANFHKNQNKTLNYLIPVIATVAFLTACDRTQLIYEVHDQAAPDSSYRPH